LDAVALGAIPVSLKRGIALSLCSDVLLAKPLRGFAENALEIDVVVFAQIVLHPRLGTFVNLSQFQIAARRHPLWLADILQEYPLCAPAILGLLPPWRRRFYRRQPPLQGWSCEVAPSSVPESLH